MHIPDQKQMFLDMQGHPEAYSDRQLEAMMDELDQKPDVEAAWQMFEQRQEPIAARPTQRWKVAASLIGVLMASGIALAAIHIVQQISANREQKAPTEETRTPNTSRQSILADSISSDTINPEPRIFENVPLDSMLLEIAFFYHINVEFQHEEARQLRFHFVWKRSESLDRVVERLNYFEAVNITKEPEKLIVR